MDKRVPEVRFKGFTDDWEQRLLSEIVKNIGTGHSAYNLHKRSEKYSYPILGSTSIIGYDSKYDYSGKFVLTARVGANAGSLYRYEGKAQITDNTVYLECEHPILLESLLNHFDLRKLSFGTGQPLIKASSLKKLKTRSPSKRNEIDNISIFLSLLEKIIYLQVEKLTLYESLKTYLMLSLFPSNGELVPKVRFNSFQNNWEQVKMINLGKSYSGLSGKSKDDFGHGEARYITYMNIFSNPIANINDLDSIELDNKQNQVKNGDVLFTISSETPEEVGMSSVWLGNSKNTYLNSFCFGFSPTADMNSFYLAFMFRSPSMRRKFMILAQGISRYNISKKRVMSMKIPMTDVREQESIGTIIKSLSDEVTNINSELIYMKKIKKYLLSKLFV